MARDRASSRRSRGIRATAIFALLIAVSVTIAILSPALPAWFPWAALLSLVLAFVGSAVRDHRREAGLSDKAQAIRQDWRSIDR